VELADQRRIMALLTVGDDQPVDRFIAGPHELAAWAEHRRAPAELVSVPPMETLQTELVRIPRECMLGPVRTVKLTEAAGQIAAQMMSPYPPGIPAIMPGERFTPAIVEFLQKVQQLEIPVPDATDSSLETVRVVA
jgi:arginine decarboxylase